MQYYIYQHADGTNDVAPYRPYSFIFYSQDPSIDADRDWQIMKARVLASNRGASPVEIQENVHKFA